MFEALLFAALLLAAPLSQTVGAVSASPAAPRLVAPTPPAAKTIVGHILAVDPKTGTVVVEETIKPPKGQKGPHRHESVTVRVDGSTRLLRGKAPATFADLRPNDHAVVRYVAEAQGARALSLRVADRGPAKPFEPGAPAAVGTPSGSPSSAAGEN